MTRAAASPHAQAPPATVPQFPHLCGQEHPYFSHCCVEGRAPCCLWEQGVFFPSNRKRGGFFFLSWNRLEGGFGSQTPLSGKTKESRSCLAALTALP